MVVVGPLENGVEALNDIGAHRAQTNHHLRRISHRQCHVLLQVEEVVQLAIDWKKPLTFLLRGDAYPCAGGSWTQLSIGVLNHSTRARTPTYLWVIGMAVCGDKDMAALATVWTKNLQVYGRFLSLSFLC